MKFADVFPFPPMTVPPQSYEPFGPLQHSKDAPIVFQGSTQRDPNL